MSVYTESRPVSDEVAWAAIAHLDFPTPGIIAIGTGVVDVTAEFPVPDNQIEDLLPEDIRALPIDGKEPVHEIDIFLDYMAQITGIPGVTIETSVGGNALNAGIVANEQTDDDVGMLTWASEDDYGKLIRNYLQRPGIIPIIGDLPENTPTGLVVPRFNGKEKDKTIIGYKPKDMDSNVVSLIQRVNGNPKLAIHNSTDGPNWAADLPRGPRLLNNKGVDTLWTPGSTHLKAVREHWDEAQAVYETIPLITAGVINGGELSDLIRHHEKGHTPKERAADRLRQGRDILGVPTLLVSFGAKGVMGYSGEGDVIGVSATRVNIVRTTSRAGDYALGGMAAHLAENPGDIEGALRRGSATASYAVETPGVLPNRQAVDRRMRKRLTDVTRYRR